MSETDRIQDNEGNDLNKLPSASAFDALLDKAEEKAAAASEAITGNENPNDEDPKTPEQPPEQVEEPEPKEPQPDTDANKAPVENTDESISDTPPEAPSAEALMEEVSNLSGVKLDEPEPEPEVPAISEELSAELTEIEQNPHTEAKVKSTIANLRNRLSEVSSEAKKVRLLEGQLEEFQNQPAGADLGITKEQLDGMQEELLMFKRRHHLESDPTFTKEFDDEIKANEKQLESLMVKYGMATTDADKKNAADVSISDLKAKGGIVKAFEDSPGFFKEVKGIIANINDFDAEDFSGMIKNIRDLNTKKQFRLEEESGKASEFFKKVDENNAELIKDQEKRDQEVVDFRTSLGVDLTKKFKFLQQKEVKGTEDQKAAATRHNERLVAHRETLTRIVNAQGLDDFKDMAEMALMSRALTFSLADALEQNKELEAKNKKISGSSRIKEVNKPPVVEKDKTFKATSNFDDALDYAEAKSRETVR